MTIAQFEFGLIGVHEYTPEGPYGAGLNFPAPSSKPGTIVAGDLGAEFTFVNLISVGGLTLNQGDFLVWDNAFNAIPMASNVTGTPTLTYPVGMFLGTIFYGGRVGDPAAGTGAGGNIWSFTFAAGVYGVWAQTKGISLGQINAVTTQATVPQTGPAIKQATFAAAGTHTNPIAPGSMAPCAQAWTFTATTTTGSAILTAVALLDTYGVVRGQQLSGTGIAAGSLVTDIGGSTVTMSLAATANGTVTITSSAGTGLCTTTNTSAVLTACTVIQGVYPNQTITGTGIPASTTIVSISAGGAPWSITMSAAATATATNIAYTTATGKLPTISAAQYIEVYLNDPTLSGATT